MSLTPMVERLPLGYDYVIRDCTGDRAIRLRSINSAWSSQLHEVPGSLLAPKAALAKHFAEPPDTDLVLTFMHHPYPWFRNDQYRHIKDDVERWSDLVFTGHEHVPGAHELKLPSQPPSLIVEGGVLQSHGSEPLVGSCYNLLEVDTDTESYSIVVKALVQSAYRTHRTHGPIEMAGLRKRARADFPISEQASAWLDDIGDIFQHPRRGRLSLPDVFECPDVTRQRVGNPKSTMPAPIEDLLGELQQVRFSLLIGDELAGKSSLLKYLYRNAYDLGRLPVYLDGQRIHANGFDSEWVDAVSAQYPRHIDREKFDVALQERGIVLVDDLDAITSVTAQNRMLALLEQRASTIVAATDTAAMSLVTSPDKPKVLAYARYQIHELGHVKRGNIIDKWVRLGADDMDLEAQARHIAYRDALLGRIIRTNLLPSSPYYVLLVLQQLEARVSDGEADTSYGYLYEAILTVAMMASRRVPTEIKYDYIAAFAGHIATKLDRSIDSADDLLIQESVFSEWHRQHCAALGISINLGDVVCDLVGSRIFLKRDGFVGFRYRTTYFYALAKWLNQRDDAELKRAVEELIAKLHLEESHVVLMFLAHFERRPFVVDLVLNGARSLLTNATDTCILAAGRELVSNLAAMPRMQLPAGTFEEKREILLSEMDGASQHHRSEAQGDGLEETRFAHDMNRAYRMISTLGQLLRRHGASIPVAAKKEMVEVCYALTVRLFGTFAGAMGTAGGSVRELLLYGLLLRSEEIRDQDELLMLLDQAFQSLIVSVAVSTIRAASEAVGTKLLKPTLDQVAAAHSESFSHSAINLAVRLDTEQRLPIDSIEIVAGLTRGSPLGKAITSQVVWLAMRRYMYKPLELTKGCEVAGIGHPPAHLLNPSTKAAKAR